MLRRFYVTLLVIAWAVSAGWLVTHKILPPLLPGQAPEAVSDLEVARRGDEVVENWFVEHEGERVGESRTYWKREADGSVVVRSRTILRNFPLQKVVQSFVGPFGAVVPATAFSEPVNFDIVSRGRYVEDRLESLALIAMYDRENQLARFDLERQEGTDYELIGSTRLMGGPESVEILRRPLSLGDSADARGPFSAGPRMLDLRVGQTWTESVAKPFTSGESEVLHVKVERQELLSWHGVPMRTSVVAYRRDTGIGRPDRRADAVAWVDDSGETLQQDVRLGSVTFRMIRMPESDPGAGASGDLTSFDASFDALFDGDAGDPASTSPRFDRESDR